MGHHACHSDGAGAIHEPFARDQCGRLLRRAKAISVLARHFQSGCADYAMVGFVLRNTLSEFGTVARGFAG